MDLRTRSLLWPQRPLSLHYRKLVARIPEHDVFLHRLRASWQRSNVECSQTPVSTHLSHSTFDFLSALDPAAHCQRYQKTSEQK